MIHHTKFITTVWMFLILSACTPTSHHTETQKPSNSNERPTDSTITTKQATNPIIVAQMGNIKLSQASLKARLQLLNAQTQTQLANNPALKKAFVRDAITREYLVAEAIKAGWEQQPQVQLQMQQAARQVLTSLYLTAQSEPPADFPAEPQVRAFYNQNKAKFQSPGSVHVAQIYLALPNTAPASEKQQIKTNIRTIYTQLKKNPADFSKIAKQRSQHQPSAAAGGDMGWIAMNALIPGMRTVIQQLKPNEISLPLETQQGLHIVKLIARKQGEYNSFDSVKTEIVKELRRQANKTNQQKFLEQLQKRVPITLTES